MAELQVQEIVTPQTYKKRSRLKVNLRQKSGAYGISRSASSAFSIKPSEVPAATVASASQTKAPQNGEGFRHLRTLSVFDLEADCFRHHLFAWPFLRG